MKKVILKLNLYLKDYWFEKKKKSYIEGKNNINENNIDIYINDKKIKFNYRNDYPLPDLSLPNNFSSRSLSRFFK